MMSEPSDRVAVAHSTSSTSYVADSVADQSWPARESTSARMASFAWAADATAGCTV